MAGPPASVPGPQRVGSDGIVDGSIVDADISASAAIARSKLAAGTALALAVNSAGGVLTDGPAAALADALKLVRVKADGTGFELATGATAADTNPAALGAVAPGVAATVSRSDHVHPLPSSSDLGLGTAAVKNVPAAGDAAAGEVVLGSDSRLTDKRTANAVYETGGPTTLAMGAVADGQYLKRSGAGIVGGSVSAAVLEQARFRGTSPLEEWYLPAGVISTTTGAPSPNKLIAARFFVASAGTIDRIGFEIVTGNAGALARVALYTTGADGYPDSLVGESGEIDCSVLGLKTATVSLAVTPGVYWLSFLANNSISSVREISSMLPFGVASTNLNLGASAVGRYGLLVSQAYGAPPSTFPAGATVPNFANSIPMMAARFA